MFPMQLLWEISYTCKTYFCFEKLYLLIKCTRAVNNPPYSHVRSILAYVMMSNEVALGAIETYTMRTSFVVVAKANI